MEIGREVEVQELADIFLKQQKDNAENINLVSPTIYANKILESIKIAKEKGLNIPIIYNSNGYESLDTLKLLNGFIDVYLPDLKYSENELAKRFSNVDDYFEVATSAIKEMERQVGKPKFNENGMIQKGLIVRHLVMPNHLENTKGVLKWFKENMRNGIYLSVMTQYFPTYRSYEYKDINRKLTKEEYEEIENYIESLELEYGYMQDFSEEDEECYVPNWDY